MSEQRYAVDSSFSETPASGSQTSLSRAEYERVMTKRILWKLDLHVVPTLSLLWLTSLIDRTNIGNARIAGLERDLHLKGQEFNIGLALFFVGYIIVDIPSNLFLKKAKANRWLPILVTVWGFVTIMTCFVKNYAGLVVIRFFLGLCEGGMLPGMILYLSSMYKRHELQTRVGLFYAGAALAGAFGGLLASAIILMDGVGGLAGWRWIFILEGIVTMIIGTMATFILPADLESAKFFTEEERQFAVTRFHQGEVDTAAGKILDSDRASSPSDEEKSDTKVSPGSSEVQEVIRQENERFEMREIIRGVFDLQAWLISISAFGLLASLYSFSLFLPTIIAGMGYKGTTAQLYTVPPYVTATAALLFCSFLSDRLKMRGPIIMAASFVTIIGYIVALVAKDNHARYAATFLIALGIFPSAPAVLSLLANNTSGYYKRAAASGLQLTIGSCGGIIATFTYTQDQFPHYRKGHAITLAMVCLAWTTITANVLFCLWENHARKTGKRQGNLKKYQELWDSGKTRAPIGDRHPDFRFTL